MSGDDIVAWVGMYMWPFFRILGMLSIAPVLGSGIIAWPVARIMG